MGIAHTPQIGEVAPDFELTDSTGARWRLSEKSADRPQILIFYRGNW
jgi:peroxiredoxin